MAQVEFPQSLFESLRTRSCVLCAGARLSTAAGLPGWEELLEQLKEKLETEDDAVTQLQEQNKLLALAGALSRKLGSETCGEVLRHAFEEVGELPEVYSALGKLPFAGALSTGFDGLLSKAMSNGEASTVYTYADGEDLRQLEDLSGRVIMALGSVAGDVAPVLSLSDFQRQVRGNAGFMAFMEELLSTRSLLLVGYRYGDPDFVLLLERLMSTFPASGVAHYALMPGVSELEAEELYDTYRVKVIGYEEDEDDNAGSLNEALVTLTEKLGEEEADETKEEAARLRMRLVAMETRLDRAAMAGIKLPGARIKSILEAGELLELDSLDQQSLCRLGNIRFMQDDLAGALACYEAAVEAEGELTGEAHLNLHHAYAEAKRFDDSLEHLNKALEIDSGLNMLPQGYELIAIIGRGTMGTIYKAKDTENDREVTVKLLRASYVREHLSADIWLEETAKLKELDHEHLATVYDAQLVDGRPVLVAQNLSGKNLDNFVEEKGTLAPEVAAEILRQTCAGLAHAHDQGILHLDITPSNIFVQEDGTAVLMDFRTGRAQKGRYVALEMGSEGFQAPELLAGAGGDARADIYSLGAVLYFILTGKRPLGSFPALSDAAPAARRFDTLVTRALRANPDDRPQAVTDFAERLAGGSEELDLPESDDDLAGWMEVLAYQPDHEEALEKVSALEETFRGEDDWDNLVTLLLGRLDYETDAEVREKTLMEVARIFEREQDAKENAFAVLQSAFRENPDNLEVQRELERLAAETGGWNDLLQEYNNLVQTLRDPKQSCEWLIRMGKIYANQMNLDDYALASFNQALALDGTRADALAELAKVLSRKEEHKELAKTLGKLADMEEDTERKVEALKEQAALYNGVLENPQDAMATYRKLLELDKANAGAISALEGLYRAAEKWEELAALLESCIERTEVAEDQRAFRRSLADIQGDQLNQKDEAIETFLALLEADPDDSGALKGLEKLYIATGRNEEYLAILDRRIAGAENDKERVTLCVRMAREWEEQKGGEAQAAEYYEKAVEFGGGDEETYKTLVRLYWAVPNYSMLAEAYRKQIDETRAVEDKVGLYAGLAKVQEEHLDDDAKAIGVLAELLELDGESKLALAGLARLQEKTEAWPAAVETLQKMANQEENIDEQAAIYCRIGGIQLRQLKDVEDAEKTLVKALELKEDHVDTLMTLSELNRDRKDFGKAARMLRDAGRGTTNELEKVKRLHHTGVTYLDDLDDEDSALEVFEELAAVDPEHVPTCERLADIYERREELDKAETVLETLVRKADRMEKDALIALNQRLGRVALTVEHKDKALTAYRAAYDLDPTSQESLQNLAELLYDQGEMDGAAKLFQALLVHRRDSLTAEETVRVFYVLGDIKERQGEQNKALNMLEKALDLEPANVKVLERAIKLYEAKDDLEAVYRCQKNLLKEAKDDETVARISEETGDLLHERLNRPGEAITFYRKAADVDPNNRRVLHKIMEVYIEERKWDEAISAMGKIEDSETDPKHRSRLHYTAAVIFRDELKRLGDAVHHLDQALIKDPTFRKAFDALKKLYSEQGNFKALAKAYRLMLQRLPEETPVDEQVTFWHELGVLCQEQLGDMREAIIAFEVADKLNPTDEAREANLASLLAAAGPDAYDKAVLVNQRLLNNNPMRLSAYRELRRIYGETGQVDKAWCVTAVLAMLDKADEEDLSFFVDNRRTKVERLTRQLTDELWDEYLYHPRQSRVLSAIFGAVSPIVAPMVVRSAQSWGLHDREKLSLVQDSRAYAREARYVGEVVGHAPAEMYLHGEMKEALGMVLAGEPDALRVVLRLSPRVVGLDDTRELLYWLTRAYTQLRPEHFLAFAVPAPTVLRAITLAGLKLVDPAVRIGGDVQEIDRLAAVFKKELSPTAFEFLTKRVDDLKASSTEEAMDAWLTGVDYSTTRAALVVTDDLATTAKLLTSEPSSGGVGAKERLRELLRFAVSEPYFELRKKMGVAIS